MWLSNLAMAPSQSLAPCPQQPGLPGINSVKPGSLRLQGLAPLPTCSSLVLSHQAFLSSVEQVERWLCSKEACLTDEGLEVGAGQCCGQLRSGVGSSQSAPPPPPSTTVTALSILKVFRPCLALGSVPLPSSHPTTVLISHRRPGEVTRSWWKCKGEGWVGNPDPHPFPLLSPSVS